jgi:hypothetical protein
MVLVVIVGMGDAAHEHGEEGPDGDCGLRFHARDHSKPRLTRT